MVNVKLENNKSLNKYSMSLKIMTVFVLHCYMESINETKKVRSLATCDITSILLAPKLEHRVLAWGHSWKSVMAEVDDESVAD